MKKHNLIGWIGALALATSGAALAAGYDAQSSMAQGVSVSVTPPDFAAGNWDFSVSMQTHMHDLGDDLKKSALLIVDNKRFVPLGWDGSPPGGHHRKGVLHFKAIVPRPASVELQIPLAGESSPRSFKWVLK